MSIVVPPQWSNSQALSLLPVPELVAIILQQQQTIHQLQHQGRPTASSFDVRLEGTKSGFPAIANQPFTPYLNIQTESGGCHLPLVGHHCWTIGRSEDNSIVLPDRWMSRNHAMLQCMGAGDFYLIDLGSRNGSFVNGRRVSIPIALHNGDVLTFGQTELKFYAPVPVPVATSTIGDATLNLQEEQMSATALLHVRRLISVLVVDIRNFTILTRKLDERLLSELIGTWFRCAGEIIREYGSWVDKYIGDAVMAVWIHGARQVEVEEIQQIFHALRALNEMTSRLHLHYPLPFQLQIGAGINTGYAMVGNTGSGDRPDYTALGDTVNAAFRLENCTKQLGLDIALGATTYEHLLPLADQLPFQEHLVDFKGYDAPTPAYGGSFAHLEQFLAARVESNVRIY